jgi:hypothetical protein
VEIPLTSHGMKKPAVAETAGLSIDPTDLIGRI